MILVDMERKHVNVLMIGDGCKWKQGTECPSLQQYYDSSVAVGMQQQWGHKEDL